MEINRDYYLNQLIAKKGDGMVKIVSGIRRCGKSYLLDPIFKNHLLSNNVPADHIIKMEMDRASNRKYHSNAELLEKDIKSLIIDEEMYYLILDEIQLVEGFEFLISGLMYEKNIDIYVTGSNSKFLSTDIITEFRGRGEIVHLNPLSFSEFYATSNMDKLDAWNEYLTYGGMPLILSKETDEEKVAYLKQLFNQTYFSDIIERYDIKRIDVMDSLVNVLASSVGSLTNPQKIYETFKSKGEKTLSINTINMYLSYLEDAFIIKKALRYDIKGRKYISTPQKYYFSDLGLRNARLNYRQQETSHLMENAIYNELIIRGFNVDVGVVPIKKNGIITQTEVDFVCNKGKKKYYIQSALNIATREKTEQESRSLKNISDNFAKMIVVQENIKPWYTEDGILIISILDFLLDRGSVL